MMQSSMLNRWSSTALPVLTLAFPDSQIMNINLTKDGWITVLTGQQWSELAACPGVTETHWHHSQRDCLFQFPDGR